MIDSEEPGYVISGAIVECPQEPSWPYRQLGRGATLHALGIRNGDGTYSVDGKQRKIIRLGFSHNGSLTFRLLRGDELFRGRMIVPADKSFSYDEFVRRGKNQDVVPEEFFNA